MAKTTKTQYCYTFKTAVKTPDIEDPATISDKLEADNVLDAFDDAIVILEAINSRCSAFIKTRIDMNDTQLILSELSSLGDRLDELSEKIDVIQGSLEVLATKAELKIKQPTQMQRILDAAPSDELLDQLEAEEHAKIMCMYPCSTTDVRKALNNA